MSEILKGSNEDYKLPTFFAGPMNSKKTTTLIIAAFDAEVANQSIMVFSPAMDTRTPKDFIQAHNGLKYPATTCTSLEDILNHLEPSTETIFVDETHFWVEPEGKTTEEFEKIWNNFLDELESREIRVFLSGLITSFKIEFMPSYLVLAKRCYVKHSYANCKVQGCFQQAPYNVMIKHDPTSKLLVPGGAERFMTVCRYHMLQTKRI